MKKIYLVTVLVAFVSFSFAQRFTNGFVKLNKAEISTTKTPTDTLVPASCLTGTPLLYSSQGGGYVCGPNGYGDVAKAQAFVNTQSINVEGCLFWVGAKEQVGTAGIVIVNLYSMDGTGTTTAGTGPCPGTVLATVNVPFDQIDSGLSIVTGLNAVNFTTPITVTADFAIGLDFATLGDDTLGIVSTTDLDAGGTELTFDKWSDATWHSFLEPNNWALDLDMYIFAVVNTAITSPIASCSPLVWAAGNVPINTSVTSGTFTLSNVGIDTLTCSGITGLSAPFTTTLVPASVSLTGGQSTTFTFTYAPTVVGIDNETVVINTNGGNITINLSGTVVGINDNYFINGIKLFQNQPNPVTNATLIQYEIQSNAGVSLEIFDITGRLVVSYDEGKQMAGKHNILVDSDKLNGGTYYYSLKAGNHRLTKKMIITQ